MAHKSAAAVLYSMQCGLAMNAQSESKFSTS